MHNIKYKKYVLTVAWDSSSKVYGWNQFILLHFLSVYISDFFKVLERVSQVDSCWESLWFAREPLIDSVVVNKKEVTLMPILSLQEESTFAKIDDYNKSNLLLLLGTI